MTSSGARWRDRFGRSRSAMRGWRQQATRVAEQTLDRARAAGRRTAAQILRIQQAAGLNRKLAQRSLESVRSRQHDRAADAAFRDGYVARAEPVLSPQLAAALVASAEPEATINSGVTRAPETEARPEDPRPGRYAPEPGAGGFTRVPPGHGRRIGRGDFATAEEAKAAADAWRDGASYTDYLAMGSGRDKEAGQ